MADNIPHLEDGEHIFPDRENISPDCENISPDRTNSPLCENMSPDPDSIKSLFQRIDVLAEKLSEERAERLETSKLVTQLASAFRKQTNGLQAAPERENIALHCEQGSDIDMVDDTNITVMLDDEPREEEDEAPESQPTEINLADLPSVLAPLKGALRSVSKRIEGLAEHCGELAGGQDSNSKDLIELSEKTSRDMCQITKSMSDLGEELTRTMEDLAQRLERLEASTAAQSAVQADIRAENATQNQHITTLRALRELDVKRADEHDQLLIRQHELIRRQGERFSTAIESLLKGDASANPSTVVSIHRTSGSSRSPSHDLSIRAPAVQRAISQGSTGKASTGTKPSPAAVSRTSSLTLTAPSMAPPVQVATLQDPQQGSFHSAKQAEPTTTAKQGQVGRVFKGSMRAPVAFLGPTTPPATSLTTRELLRARSWSPDAEARRQTTIVHHERSPAAPIHKAVSSRSAARERSPVPMGWTAAPPRRVPRESSPAPTICTAAPSRSVTRENSPVPPTSRAVPSPQAPRSATRESSPVPFSARTVQTARSVTPGRTRIVAPVPEAAQSAQMTFQDPLGRSLSLVHVQLYPPSAGLSSARPPPVSRSISKNS